MPDSYKPTAEMARVARAGLAMRKSLPPSRRGGTAVGIARARDIANRTPLSLETVKRMRSFFARHAESPGSAEARRDKTSKAAQAWALWGGSPGRAWANRIIRDTEGE